MFEEEQRLQVDDEISIPLHPVDAASEVSMSALQSNTGTTRLQLAARAARLKAELSLMKKHHELEKEEQLLKQKREQFEIEMRIATTIAEEEVYKSEIDTGLESPLQQTENITTPEESTPESHAIMRQFEPQLSADTVTGQVNQVNSARPATDNAETESSRHQQLLAAVHMPHAELVYFDGNPLEYWTFLRSFENSVERVCDDDVSRLTRLLQYCTGKARKLIQGCTILSPKEGYQRARALLKERFGNDYVIAEAWIAKITDGKPIGGQDGLGLREYADDLSNCHQTLKAMNYLSEVNTQRVLARIVSRLPGYLQNRWLREVREIRTRQDRPADINDLTKFVNSAAEEANDPVYGKIRVKQHDSGPGKFHASERRSNRGQSYVTSTDNPRPSAVGPVAASCVLCSGSHSVFRCEEFRRMRPEERCRFARSKRLCFNCLKGGHRSDACNLARTCSVPGCNQKHTKFLHQVTNRDPVNTTSHSRPGDTNNAEPVVEARSGYVEAGDRCMVTGAGTARVVLPIIPVKVWSGSGHRCISTYALLDNGSTTTFCTVSLARSLELTGNREVLNLSTLECSGSSIETTAVSLNISDMHEQNTIHLDKVYTKQELPISLQNGAKADDIRRWSHLRDIEVYDTDTGSVDLLIGQNCPDALMPLEVRTGDKLSSAPYAVRTMLGWTIQGPVYGPRQRTAVVNFVQNDVGLHEAIHRFWELDSREVTDDTKGMSVEDRQAMAVMEKSITRVEGHYEMAIPFKQRPAMLPDNKPLAEARLQCLRRRLSRDEELQEKYCRGMEDMVTKGYASKVEAEDIIRDDGAVWYLPHHPVVNSKKSDKVRIVFDCAAKFKGTSLNEKVLQGPDLTNKLVGVLLRFRQERIAIMGDIEAMFNQVNVVPEDRDVLRYLWWPDGDLTRDPEIYRMNVHLFGGTWSPSCCNFALRRTAMDNQESYSAEAVNTVLRNFYVDDCLKSVEDEEKATNLVTELTELLKCGGFRLTKWVSSSKDVLASIPETERSAGIRNVDMSLEKECLPAERALGILWDTEDDSFVFRTNPKKAPWTKRGLLSIVCSVYDPMGLISPFTLKGKKLMQDITRQKLDWDEVLPEKELLEWRKWIEELTKLESVRIPRSLKPHDGNVEYELHHFADASSIAYGSASYIRMIFADGKVSCKLLLAKSRLAPLKTATLPRLELMAATLAVRMHQMIQRELDISILKTVFWTDSTIVLQYIRNEHKRFHTFVANRIAVIHDSSSPSQWRHVPSRCNAADDVSRGLSADELLTKSRWWNGPSFLWLSENMWPEQQVFSDLPSDDPEAKRDASESKSYSTTAEADPCDIVDKLLTRRSSWIRLKADVGWILRFVSYRLGRVSPQLTRYLSVEELDTAETAILRYIQRKHFCEDFTVNANSELNLKKNSPLRKLDPFVKENGLLCVGGRLRHSASISDQAKHPVILPKFHSVVDLIVRHVHESHGHVGKEHVLSLLHEKYWIISGRSTVRRVLGNCSRCRLRDVKPTGQLMSDLPTDRITAGEPPFTYAGVDLFGPFNVKRGRSVVKRYGCVFTCLKIRAVHIEVVQSLDADSFINALQRFICRRGQPKELRSDNATNFVGAEKELRVAIEKWNKNKLHSFLQQNSIEWKFNTPTASHMGGVWERQIRSIRRILSILMKEQSVDDESLSTLFCLVESILNSRPLTTVSSDHRDLEPLTPNHLLLLQQDPVLPPDEFVKQDIYSRRRWRQVQYLADIFWRRWIREYLPTLQFRQKWKHPVKNLEVGDIVILADENMPRNSWQLGRVTEAYPSSDGFVRSVKVATKTTTLLRPVHKLCLLESVSA